MNPYFENGDVTLYHGAVREFLDAPPAFDHVISDPPYRSPWSVQEAAERLSEGMSEGWMALVQPGTKRLGTIQLSDRSFATVALPKEARQFFGSGMGALDVVVAWHFPEMSDDIVLPVGAVDVDEPRPKTSHPNPRPLWLMRALVSAFSSPGDTVFDPFAGSGTTLLAAAEMGRKAIGIEIDEARCEDAARRLS